MFPNVERPKSGFLPKPSSAGLPDDARTSSGGKGDVAAGADFDLKPDAFLGVFRVEWRLQITAAAQRDRYGPRRRRSVLPGKSPPCPRGAAPQPASGCAGPSLT